MGKELKIWLNVNPYSDKQLAKQYSDNILQRLLCEYCPNQSVFDIRRSKNGKPYLEQGPHFSYAHCGRLYAYVLDNKPIGIDVEKISSKRNVKGVAQRHYHESEWNLLYSMNDSDQRNLFFRWWAQKEAWCKHQGGVLWNFLPQALTDSGLFFFDVFSIKGMACSIATETPVSGITVNVMK